MEEFRGKNDTYWWSPLIWVSGVNHQIMGGRQINSEATQGSTATPKPSLHKLVKCVRYKVGRLIRMRVRKTIKKETNDGSEW